MNPLTHKASLRLIAYTGAGRVHHQDPAPELTLAAIAEAAAPHCRGAVTHDDEGEYYLTFDLTHVSPKPPYAVARRWWMSLSKARAIALALWFARDGG